MKRMELTLLSTTGRMLLLLVLASPLVVADEGMWTFNNVPKRSLKERYGFEPTDAWLGHLRLASVRFNSGGSGSFVSADGLTMTNHHIAADCLQKLSSSGKDYYRNGFYAAARQQEGRCPDLELNVLTEIEDVTTQVNQGVKPDMDAAQIFAAQRAGMSTLEKNCTGATGLRCDVITLYQGGVFNLYKYKRYTDVRLVFAPESDVAFFGGDPDNFTYPRYDLDVAFFRVYEDGKPATISHYLRWSKRGTAEGELVFVSGHPGTTNRMNTLARLEYLRDKGYPFILASLDRTRATLQRFSEEGEENARIAKEELFSVENSIKALSGEVAGLRDPEVMGKRADAERELRAAVAAEPKKQAAYGKAWDGIAAAQAEVAAFYRERAFFESGLAFNSRLFAIARTLVRLAAEKQRPNTDRLREYRESNLPSLELNLYSPAPIYDSFEKIKLIDSLEFLRNQLGESHPLVVKVLDGKTPQQLASEVVSGTRLMEVAVRRAVAAGGERAILESTDPMIQLAVKIDEDGRALRKRYEDRVQGVERVNYALIAKANFELKGTSVYPDATFTLRLSLGPVRRYTENGKNIAPFTNFAGLYDRASLHANKSPYQLPQRWLERKSKLSLATPLNFVSTADIIGGNSGSPVVNRSREIVGLIFDGNIQSLVWNFLYDDRQGRAIAVDSRGIVEALQNIYNARELVQELQK
ncbi:MAG: S46 family peptidase [Acidobacteria bacterium]|nr:S46 family peptidase [Acidobacteriota bacterium]